MKTFRFSTYINGNTSTQDEGVIGLLNEFHAYYLGARFTYDMLEPYKEAEGLVKGLHYWVSHSQSIMSAYYEFDYFIKEYLLYMEAHYASDYNALKSNTAFKEVYLSIRRNFKTLVHNYETVLDSQMKILNESKKAEVVIEEGTLWITPEGSKTRIGTEIFSEDKDKIISILKTGRYKSVEKDFI
ncbi:MAG TPA: hypothetical protein VHO90_16335 [Bacteroidales bacterium]|nr:hypothetical protein [Bacteroidales bacterium]